MKNLLLLSLMSLVNIWTAYSQYTQIPDPGFEQALIDLGIDSEGVLDGQVLTSDIEAIEELTLDDVYFDNLIGLEDFTSLKGLVLALIYTEDTLDLSIAPTLENLYYYGGIDASVHIDLVDLTNNPNLKNFEIIDDWGIYAVDLRGSDQYITDLNIDYEPGYWFGDDDPPPDYTTPKLCVLVTDPDAVRNREGNYANWYGYNINFTTDCTLSVSDFEIADFKIYPNPTKELFQIETTADMESISVYDIQGKRIKSYKTSQQNYSVADLASGLYFLKLKLKTGEGFMKKLLVD